MKKLTAKILSVAMAVCTAVSLAACGGGNSGGSSSGGANKNEITVDGAVYQRERGDVMFFEKEDLAQDDTVIQDMSICIYNYCPSVMQVDENTRYVYYCSNKYTAGKTLGEGWMDIDGDDQITDYIAARKGIKHNGEWYWGEKKYVLKPSKNSETEGEQTCDPNVIAGDFTYNGTKYGYLMAYLACNTRNNHYNHICFAVANDPMGPWKKCSDINPFHRYTTEAYTNAMGQQIPAVPGDFMNTYLWGYGQASMINADKSGRVQMFYTAIKPMYVAEKNKWWHGTLTIVERWDLSNLNAPVCEYQIENMNCYGVKRGGGQVETVTNGDYAYDSRTNRIYAVFDGGVNGAPVAYLTNHSKAETPVVGDVFKDYLYEFPGANMNTPADKRWTTFAAAKSDNTHNYTTFHNTAVIRDEYGWLDDFSEIEVAITGDVGTAVTDVFPEETNKLWSYRIIRKSFELPA